MNENIVLSICIPTLGGSDRLEEGLKRIFEYKGHDIEVVISDNDTTGKIQPTLSKFADDRLQYYANDRNYGAFYNWIKVLTYGKGKYLLTLNDIDWIAKGGLPAIVDFLKKESASVIVGYPHERGKIFYTENEKNGYSCTGEETHPSCFILKRENFQRIEDVISLCDKIEAYVQATLALLCSKNDRVCINRKIPIIEMPDEKYYLSHVSRTNAEIAKSRNGAYYTPQGSLVLMESYITICREYFSEREINRMVPYLYLAHLKRATIEYKYWSKMRIITERYGLPFNPDIDINIERKRFCKNAKKALRKLGFGREILLKISFFTFMNKISTSKTALLNKTYDKWHYAQEKYAWARTLQKWKRKIVKE